MTQPVIWCIGGIDSSGGAGVTRDALTLADLHLHACVITTQITVQSNTRMLTVTLLALLSSTNNGFYLKMSCLPAPSK